MISQELLSSPPEPQAASGGPRPWPLRGAAPASSWRRGAERYRVIVIERPGYGYSERPRWLWTPRAHATLYEHALQKLGVERAIVLGHSWGTMVAVSLALQAPTLVRSLVLLSGYYFPRR